MFHLERYLTFNCHQLLIIIIIKLTILISTSKFFNTDVTVFIPLLLYEEGKIMILRLSIILNLKCGTRNNHARRKNAMFINIISENL